MSNPKDEIYLEPRQDYDACILKVDGGVVHYKRSAVMAVTYQLFLAELKRLEAIAGRSYAEYGEPAEKRADAMVDEWVSSQEMGPFVFEDV